MVWLLSSSLSSILAGTLLGLSCGSCVCGYGSIKHRKEDFENICDKEENLNIEMRDKPNKTHRVRVRLVTIHFVCQALT